MNTTDLGALILAAGSARRMGADKLLLPVGDRLMIGHVIAAAHAAGLAGPIVAHRPDDVTLAGVLDAAQVQRIAVQTHALGMGASLSAALAVVPEQWRAICILLGDMPLISPDLLRAMAQQSSETAIVIPTHDGRRGNPVIWGRAHFAALAALAGDVGGRSLLPTRADSVVEMAWRDDSIFIDVDTPEALVAVNGRF